MRRSYYPYSHFGLWNIKIKWQPFIFHSGHIKNYMKFIIHKPVLTWSIEKDNIFSLFNWPLKIFAKNDKETKKLSYPVIIDYIDNEQIVSKLKINILHTSYSTYPGSIEKNWYTFESYDIVNKCLLKIYC